MLLPAELVLSVDYHQVVLDKEYRDYVRGPSSAADDHDAPHTAGQAERAADRPSPHYLLGRRVVRRIEGPLGVIVADAGDIVTEETIRRAEGSEALLILSLSVE